MNFKEVHARYGGVTLHFTGYWKYVFNFEGKAVDGSKIHLSLGGDGDDIYKMGVGPTTTFDDEHILLALTVYDKDGELIFTGDDIDMWKELNKRDTQ